MINLFVAGAPDFIERVSRGVETHQQEVRIISMSSDAATAVDLLERSAKECHAVLLGFDEGKNQVLVNTASRYGIKYALFVAVPDLLVGHRKWAAFGAQAVQVGSEIKALLSYFKQNPVANEVSRRITDVEEDSDVAIAARVSNVKVKSMTGAVGVPRKVASVFSFKGGVGKTAITVSIGLSLTALTDLRVCIVDLDTSRNYGDVIKYLGLYGPEQSKIDHTLVSWRDFPFEQKASREIVESYLVKPPRKKIFALPAMHYMAEASSLSPDLVARVIDTLRRHFDLVLLDLGNYLTDLAITAMELSDEVLIVDTLDIPEVWTLKEFLETTMPHVRIQRSQISIVFNRIIAGSRNDPADAAKFLGFPYIAAIPEDMELRKMLANRGDVPYLGGQDIPFTRELEKILFRLFPREIFPKGSGKEAPKGGFAGFLRKIGLAG